MINTYVRLNELPTSMRNDVLREIKESQLLNAKLNGCLPLEDWQLQNAIDIFDEDTHFINDKGLWYRVTTKREY